MKTILITGGLGFVGGRLSKAFSHHFKVIASTRGEITPQIKSIFPDVSFVSHSALFDLKTFPEDVDIVIHLAAMNEHDCLSNPEQAIEVNINQTRRLCDNAIASGVSRFIYFSTTHVYGRIEEGIVDENSLPRPIHPYAITHRAAEDYVLAALDSGKIKGEILRLSNSFGCPVSPHIKRWTLLVNDIARQSVLNREIRLNSNGSQHRDFITLEDVVDALKFLIDLDQSRFSILNLSRGKSLTVLAMARLVADAYKRFFGANIEVTLPLAEQATPQKGFTIVPSSLNTLGFRHKDEVPRELDNLIAFCNKHFGVR